MKHLRFGYRLRDLGMKVSGEEEIDQVMKKHLTRRFSCELEKSWCRSDHIYVVL